MRRVQGLKSSILARYPIVQGQFYRLTMSDGPSRLVVRCHSEYTHVGSGCSFGHWGPSVWYHNNNSQQDLHESVHKLVRRSFIEIRLKMIWLTVGPYLCRICLDSRPRTAAVYLSRYASRTNASVCLRAGIKTNPMNQTRLTHLNVTE